MNKHLKQFLIVLAVWVPAMLIFDAWLGITGGWLMVAGAFTFVIGEAAIKVFSPR